MRSSRKKRTRSYATQKPKYWSEYDNPSDSDDDAYVIFIDPNAESSLSQTWRKIQDMFKPKAASGEEPLLQAGAMTETSLDSSDEEAQTPRRSRTTQSYGTLDVAVAGDTSRVESKKSFWLPPITMTCLGASIAILIVGYLLAMTGRRKQVQEVDAGIIFAIVSSLLFAISGVASLFSLGRCTVWAARLVALAVLAVDAIASGALLAWILA